MATINVKDAAGSTVALEKPLAAGQAAMAASRPVVIASDQASIPVASTLTAETTKVIGVTRTADGAGNLLTSTGNAIDINFKTGLALNSGATSATTLRTILASDSPGIITTGSQASPSSSYLSSVVAGDIANDAVDSGNPAKIGSKAIAGQSTATLVSAGDRVENYAGLDGVKLMRPHCGLEDIVTGNATNTDGTSTQCIAASGAGVKTYLTSVVLANTSATAITVDIKDGSTVKTSLPLPAGSGCIYNPPVPIPGTANTAWNFDGSAAATTVTCSMVGFKSKV